VEIHREGEERKMEMVICDGGSKGRARNFDWHQLKRWPRNIEKEGLHIPKTV